MAQIGYSGIALVTGASNGIGKAIAARLAEADFNVAAADVVPFENPPRNINHYQCDVSDGKQVDELYARMNSEIGLPDVLVLNAGIGIHEMLTEGDPEKWFRVINTNLIGPLRFVRAFVPPMVQKKRGHVVFISSVAADQPYTYGGVYSATKAGLERIAETLRLETAPDISVTVVSAGVTDTNFFENQVSAGNTVESIGMGAIKAKQIAEDVFYAISRPQGTALNKIIIRPSGQTF